jgi:hypothetical protein
MFVDGSQHNKKKDQREKCVDILANRDGLVGCYTAVV